MISQQKKTGRRGLVSSFTEHPASVGESYLQHYFFATRFSGRLLAAAGAAFMHALVPAWFEKTASQHIGKMHQELTDRENGT